jgi:2-oxoacid:acceptor oxidoreductase gamma subunit (pyruvate/2-ketoisovalerate family)
LILGEGGYQMQEMRFHGRGGQGTVVASILLAEAFFSAGFYVQSFPAFGVERRGAPVEAYLRIDSQKIRLRTSISAPDCVLVQDSHLLATVDVTKGLAQDGRMLINMPAEAPYADAIKGFRLARVDATRIGVDHGLGTRTHPMVNTAMVGAFARIMTALPLDCLTAAIKTHIAVEPERNIAAAVEAYETVQF